MGLTGLHHRQFCLAIVFNALSVIPQILGRVSHGYLLSQMQNNLAWAVELGINIFLWAGAVLIAYFTKKLDWMALWGLIVQTAGFIVLSAIVASMIHFKWRFEMKILRRMLSFSSYGFIENLANIFFLQFDRILVGFILGPTAAGVYSVGTSIGLRLSIITVQATEVMIPYASRKQTAQHQIELYDTFKALLKISSLLIGLIASLLIVFMREILTIWISASYADLYTVAFQILILAYACLSLRLPGHQTLTGIGKVRFIALVYLGTSILMITALYWLTIRFGLHGSAYANMIIVLLVVYNIYVHIQLAGGLSIKGMLGDLAWGGGIPLLSFWIFSFVTTELSISVKLIYLLLVMIIVFIILWREPFAQKYLYRKLKTYF